MELFIGIVVGLIILVLLVVMHEFGHAIQAYRSGVTVEEFGVGFPPRALAKKLKNGILFTINWLPIGGFVKLKGEYDSANEKGDYGAASFWQKTKILFAGVAVNWIFAAILLTFLAITGLPKVLPNQFSIANDKVTVSQPVEVSSIIDNYPAKKAGLKIGDRIISFNGQNIINADQLIGLVKQNVNKNTTFVYLRDGVEHKVVITLGDSTSTGTLGAGLGQREFIKATWSAPIVGVFTTAQLTWETIKGVGGIFSGIVSGGLSNVGDSVAGPIGIIGTVFPAAAQAGLTQLTFLAAIISISLAVMNILPIPSLDGGRWFTMTIFRLFKKKLTKEREEKIQTIGMIILMALVILVTFNDIAKLF